MQDRTTSPEACPDRQLLILDAVQPEVLPAAMREQLLQHLCVCSDCAGLYDRICAADLQLGQSSDAAGLMDQDEAGRDVWRRIAAKQTQARPGHRRQVLYRISKAAFAAAACLLLAVSLTWWHNPNKSAAPALTNARPFPGPGSVPPSANPLGESAAGLPDSQPFDPNKTDYATWLKEHESWFASTFPWTFEIQRVLHAHGVTADYVELLVVSGDIWQFRFNPDGPIGQPLAVHSPVATERLAAHYRVPIASLREVTVPATPAAQQSWDTDTSAAASLERLRKASLSVAHLNGAAQTDLLISSLRAAKYLHDTRAAVCLWIGRNPQLAQSIQAGDARAQGSLAMPASVSVQSLSEQCDMARRIIQAASQSLSASSSGCASDGRKAEQQ